MKHRADYILSILVLAMFAGATVLFSIATRHAQAAAIYPVNCFIAQAQFGTPTYEANVGGGTFLVYYTVDCSYGTNSNGCQWLEVQGLWALNADGTWTEVLEECNPRQVACDQPMTSYIQLSNQGWRAPALLYWQYTLFGGQANCDAYGTDVLAWGSGYKTLD